MDSTALCVGLQDAKDGFYGVMCGSADAKDGFYGVMCGSAGR